MNHDLILDRDAFALWESGGLSAHLDLDGLLGAQRGDTLTMHKQRVGPFDSDREKNAPRPDPLMSDAELACGDVFHWVGQTLTSCDVCGRPFWEHRWRYAPPPAGKTEITPQEAESCRRQWAPRRILP